MANRRLYTDKSGQRHLIDLDLVAYAQEDGAAARIGMRDVHVAATGASGTLRTALPEIRVGTEILDALFEDMAQIDPGFADDYRARKVRRNAEIFEPEWGRFYYLVEAHDAPGEAPQWREHAICYGPFPSLEKAQQHMDEILCVSPIRTTIIHHHQFEMTPLLEEAIAYATLDPAH